MFSGKTKSGVEVSRTLGMKSEKHRPIWVVVADQSKARIFQWVQNEPLQSLCEIDNPEGKEKGSNLTSDKPGRTFESHSQSHHGQTGGLRHAYSKDIDPHEKVVQAFTHQVTKFLEEARKKNRFEELVLVANSRMLGMLQDALDKATRGLITATHDKDYAWVPDAEVIERLVPLLKGE